MSIPEDDVSLDIGDLPDSMFGESVGLASVDDAETTSLTSLDSLTAEPAPPVILPWKTTARFPALSRTLPCTLDPTRATSLLVVAEPPSAETQPLQIVVGALNDAFVFPVEAGEPEQVVLGRDVLAGRVWVDCAPVTD